jgi:sugar lactone lactonase YvrE
MGGGKRGSMGKRGKRGTKGNTKKRGAKKAEIVEENSDDVVNVAKRFLDGGSSAPTSMVSVHAGTGGPSTVEDDPRTNNSTYNWLQGIACHPNGTVFTSEGFFNCIRKIPINAAGAKTGITFCAGRQNPYYDPSTGTVNRGSTGPPADGAGVNAIFGSGPWALALNREGTLMYINDFGNNCIRRMDVANNNISTFKTNIIGLSGICVDKNGTVYVTTGGNNTIVKIEANGTQSTLCGTYGQNGNVDGVGAAARFNNVTGIVCDKDSQYLFVSDEGNRCLRRITIADGRVVSYIRNIDVSAGLAVDNDSAIYVAQPSKHTITMISPTGIQTIIAGATNQAGGTPPDGAQPITGTTARFNGPRWLCVGSVPGSPTNVTTLYVCDVNNFVVKKIQVLKPVVNAVTVCPTPPATQSIGATGMIVATTPFPAIISTYLGSGLSGNMPNIYASSTAGAAASATNQATTAAKNALLNRARGICIDKNNVVYIADTGNHTIRKVVSSIVTNVAGNITPAFRDGIGSAADFSSPEGIVVDSNATNLYIADTGNHRIRKIVIATGAVTTVAGTGVAGFADGAGNAATFSSPKNLDITADGTIYVADFGNKKIRVISPTGQVSTPTWGNLVCAPLCVQADTNNNIYVGSSDGNIYKVNLLFGQLSIYTGQGKLGFLDGNSSTALFNGAAGFMISNNGKLYVADTGNNRIRVVDTDGSTSTLAGTGDSGYVDTTASISAANCQFNAPNDVAIDSAGNLYVIDTGNSCIRQITIASPSAAQVMNDIANMNAQIDTDINTVNNPNADPSARATAAQNIVATFVKIQDAQKAMQVMYPSINTVIANAVGSLTAVAPPPQERSISSSSQMRGGGYLTPDPYDTDEKKKSLNDGLQGGAINKQLNDAEFVLPNMPAIDNQVNDGDILTTSQQEVPLIAAAPVAPVVDDALILAYRNQLTRRWVRSEMKAGVPNAVVFPVGPANRPANKSASHRGVFQTDRLCVVLPMSTKKIFVFSPVKGDVRILESCFSHLDNVLPAEERNTAVLLFSPPFYGDTYADNLDCFKRFVSKTKEVRAGAAAGAIVNTFNAYILTEHTEDNYRTAYDFCHPPPAVAQAVAQAPAICVGGISINLLEPSYVLYPYRNIYKDVGASKSALTSGLLFSAAAENETVLPISAAVTKDPITHVTSGKRTDVAFKVGDISKRTSGLQKAKPGYTTRRMIPLKKSNALKDEQAFSDQELLIYTSEAAPNAYVTIYNIGGLADLEGVEQVAERKRRSIEIKEFYPAQPRQLFSKGVQEVVVSIGAHTYKLRQPSNPGVTEDWKKLLFTEEEAQFLNDLNIRPDRLNAMNFGGGVEWPDKLSDNLEVIVQSNCFRDSVYILHSKCKDTREFIQKIMKDLLDNQGEENIQEIIQQKAVSSLSKVPTTAPTAAPGVAAPQGDPFVPVDNNPYHLAEDEIEQYDINESNFDFRMYKYLAYTHTDRNGVSTDYPDEYGRYILVIKKSDPTNKRLGYISIPVGNPPIAFDDASKRTEAYISNLKKDFPAYIFVP